FTAGDGYCWRFRRYLPSGPPRARVVCLHGIQSHGGWYVHSCDLLRQAGFARGLLGRRGSGPDGQERGERPRVPRLLDDRRELPPEDAGRPVFLLAISWGGKLALALPRRHPGLTDGVALLCPGLYARVRPSRKQRLGIFWARLVAPRRLFPIPLNDPELFTAT